VLDTRSYTTQLQAGLGLVDETKTLLDLWSQGMSAAQLYQAALSSGRFPTVTARRLRNIVVECFAPRYLVDDGAPAAHLKRLSASFSTPDLTQLMLIFTSRANPIFGDFVRDVYWVRYTGGYEQITNDDARVFVERGLDDGKMAKRWSGTRRRACSRLLSGSAIAKTLSMLASTYADGSPFSVDPLNNECLIPSIWPKPVINC
jgi:BrxA